jgi:hypothetical protein
MVFRQNGNNKTSTLVLLAFVCLLVRSMQLEDPHHDCATAREFQSQEDSIQEDQAELEMFGKTVRYVTEITFSA